MGQLLFLSGALVTGGRPDFGGGGRDADHLPFLLAVPLRPALPHRHVGLPLRAAALHHGARLQVFRLVRSGRISFTEFVILGQSSIKTYCS